MDDLKLSQDLIDFIHESYKIHNLIYDDELSLDEFVKKQISVRDSFFNILNEKELDWVKDNFNQEELSIIRTKYNEKKQFLAEKDATINKQFKVSIIKNCASEMFIQRELGITDLRTQKFKVIFSAHAKLETSNWTLLTHRKSWYKRDKPSLNKDFAIIVTLNDEKTPEIAAIIDKATFNKYAVKSNYTDHIILKRELFDDAISNTEKYLKEIKKSIMYQTHIDHKTYSALNKLKKSYFNELKNAEEMFELIVDFWHNMKDTKLAESKLTSTIEYYYAESKKRLINYNKNCKEQLHEIRSVNYDYTPDILIRAAFNNSSMLKDWYLNK